MWYRFDSSNIIGIHSVWHFKFQKHGNESGNVQNEKKKKICKETNRKRKETYFTFQLDVAVNRICELYSHELAFGLFNIFCSFNNFHSSLCVHMCSKQITRYTLYALCAYVRELQSMGISRISWTWYKPYFLIVSSRRTISNGSLIISFTHIPIKIIRLHSFLTECNIF